MTAAGTRKALTPDFGGLQEGHAPIFRVWFDAETNQAIGWHAAGMGGAGATDYNFPTVTLEEGQTIVVWPRKLSDQQALPADNTLYCDRSHDLALLRDHTGAVVATEYPERTVD